MNCETSVNSVVLIDHYFLRHSLASFRFKYIMGIDTSIDAHKIDTNKLSVHAEA